MTDAIDVLAKLELSLVNPQRSLDAVYAERVEQAKALLGPDVLLLRAAD